MARLLADHSEEDLQELLDEAKDDLFNLRFQSVIGQLDNTSLLGAKKKEVARILTELRMREIAYAEELEANPEAATKKTPTKKTKKTSPPAVETSEDPAAEDPAATSAVETPEAETPEPKTAEPEEEATAEASTEESKQDD